MRALLIVPFCLAAAACSGGDDSANQAAAAPETLPAGTWQVQFEVKKFTSADKTTPALKAKEGDKEQASVCMAGTQPAQAAPELFAGPGYSCSYQNSYIRGGTINATIACTRPELKGQVNMAIQGTYTADSFEATVDSTSFLPGPGDFTMSRKLKGKLKPGDCQAAPPADAAAGNASASAGAKDKKGG
jgi:hypothetical protein